MRRALWATLRRDLMVTARHRADAVTGLVFFVVVASLFPLGVGSEPRLLREIGPGVVWVAALLASLLSLPRLFVADHADGTLEQLLLRPHPLPLLALAKVAGHWLTTGLPLVLVSPLLGLQYGLDGPAIMVLLLSLLVGTPVLSLLGAVGAALALGLRGSGVLTALIVLPLNAPLLIFGSGVVQQQMAGMPVQGLFSLLGALLVAGLVTVPFALGQAMRIACE
ncbi:MAG: heme exporter protein CcmB [Rubrivivax sp.]|nr:heme exporter protein CcmB [Rubrivivax sp.]MBK7264289.1 heme exporter protein CcmB [Rubrivivax sp.]MBK8527799.1 heme exporter protein CcmB [Rubrivivax sp.]